MTMSSKLQEILAKKRAQVRKQDDLIACLAVPAIKAHMSFNDFRTLTEYFGVYNFIPLHDRTVSFDMLAYLTKGAAGGQRSAREIFKAWLIADLVETCLTEAQQDIVMKYLYKDEL